MNLFKKKQQPKLLNILKSEEREKKKKEREKKCHNKLQLFAFTLLVYVKYVGVIFFEKRPCSQDFVKC